MSVHPYDDGHTVAGWTGCGIASAGAAVTGLGVCRASAVWVAAGLGIAVVALLVTWILHLAGWGKGPGRRPKEEWSWRVRDLGARDGHAGCLGCRLAGRGGRRAGRGGRRATAEAGDGARTARVVRPAGAVDGDGVHPAGEVPERGGSAVPAGRAKSAADSGS
ncbi:HGxxPAAW family protein [Streptomyces leeuwenhoekii]|uniref:HGxxPAAW family protein n=1 Tax=Streptomyces leeuwenhoekii TaxID=1437453 RepID=UPI000ABBCBC8|nr:HGxxPAAW family protein [Streptomyces leeuwenhoekii]